MRAPNLTVTGPKLVRFDLAAVKRRADQRPPELRVPRRDAERLQLPWFTPVTGADDDGLFSDADEFRVSELELGAREVQLIWRINW